MTENLAFTFQYSTNPITILSRICDSSDEIGAANSAMRTLHIEQGKLEVYARHPEIADKYNNLGLNNWVLERIRILNKANDEIYHDALELIRPHLETLKNKGAEEALDELNLDGLSYIEARELILKTLRDIDSTACSHVFEYNEDPSNLKAYVAGMTSNAIVGLTIANHVSRNYELAREASVEQPELPPKVLEAVEKARGSGPSGNPAYTGAKPANQSEQPAPAK